MTELSIDLIISCQTELTESLVTNETDEEPLELSSTKKLKKESWSSCRVRQITAGWMQLLDTKWVKSNYMTGILQLNFSGSNWENLWDRPQEPRSKGNHQEMYQTVPRVWVLCPEESCRCCHVLQLQVSGLHLCSIFNILIFKMTVPKISVLNYKSMH